METLSLPVVLVLTFVAVTIFLLVSGYSKVKKDNTIGKKRKTKKKTKKGRGKRRTK